jgi:glycosyltransferase involved in cell wall biosynthesis
MTSFSILTPSFQYARFITDALESVRQQDVAARVEHVVVDGGSTDGTTDILERYDDVRWISERDGGQSDALNKALTSATGDIIGWLNADEFYLEGAIATARQVFDTTGADVVFGDSTFVDGEGRQMRLVPQHRFNTFVLEHYGCYIPSCAFFVRRAVLDHSPWDTSLSTVMDWDLYLSLARKGCRFEYVPRPLGAFRVHPARVTAVELPKHSPERLRVRERYGLTNRSPRREISRGAGRALHSLLKTREGSYARQVRARRASGSPLQWWSDPAVSSDPVRAS